MVPFAPIKQTRTTVNLSCAETAKLIRAALQVDAQKFLIDQVRGHTFLKNYLNRRGKVVDLGMNKGEFARTINSRYGCSVAGVEANPDLAANIADLGGGITCKNAAIAAHDGSVKFSINRENSEASTIVSDSTPLAESVVVVPSISLSTFFREIDAEQIDLLKIDVEGAELDIIETTPEDIFRQCSQISIEFHSFLYPLHSERVEKAITLLTGLGFYCIDFSISRHDVLFLNRRVIDVSAAAKTLLVFQKYQAGITRRLRRIALGEK